MTGSLWAEETISYMVLSFKLPTISKKLPSFPYRVLGLNRLHQRCNYIITKVIQLQTLDYYYVLFPPPFQFFIYQIREILIHSIRLFLCILLRFFATQVLSTVCPKQVCLEVSINDPTYKLCDENKENDQSQ